MNLRYDILRSYLLMETAHEMLADHLEEIDSDDSYKDIIDCLRLRKHWTDMCPTMDDPLGKYVCYIDINPICRHRLSIVCAILSIHCDQHITWNGRSYNTIFAISCLSEDILTIFKV